MPFVCVRVWDGVHNGCVRAQGYECSPCVSEVCANAGECVRQRVGDCACERLHKCVHDCAAVRAIRLRVGRIALACDSCVCVCVGKRARAHAFQRVLAASTSPRVAARSCAAIAAVQPSIWFCSDGARALRRAARPRYRQHGHTRAHTMDG